MVVLNAPTIHLQVRRRGRVDATAITGGRVAHDVDPGQRDSADGVRIKPAALPSSIILQRHVCQCRVAAAGQPERTATTGRAPAAAQVSIRQGQVGQINILRGRHHALTRQGLESGRDARIAS